MFKAQAVWKTDNENQFNPAGFDIDVDVSVNHELGMDKTQELYGYMREGKCDGFVIDVGTNKIHIIKS